MKNYYKTKIFVKCLLITGTFLHKSFFGTQKSCPLYRGVRYKLFAITRFYYKDLTTVPSLPENSVPYIEVSAINGVHYIDVSLY